MKSTTSYFNLAFFKSNIKRHGVYSILFFILNGAIVNLGIMVNMVRLRNDGSIDMIDEMFSNPWDMAMAFIVPVLFAVILFRFLMEDRALSAIHAMPISRKSLYLTQLMTFECLYGVPVLANTAISATILLVKGMGLGQVLFYSIFSFLLLMLLANMIFAFAVFMGMVVGSSILQVALTYIIMGAPFILVELSRLLLRWTLRGFPRINGEFPPHHWLTPYFSGVSIFQRNFQYLDRQIVTFAVVIVFTLGLGGINFLLYQKRDLERHTDLIVFGKAKTILSALLTAMVTLAMATLIAAMMNEDKQGAYFGVAIGSLIGFTVMKMISDKTVSIARYWKHGLITVVGCILLLAVIDLDLVGYEKRMPADDNIHSVYYLEDGWLPDLSLASIEESLNRYNANGAMLYNDESIQKVKDLHRTMIDEGGSTHMVHKNINLVYVLNNGRKVHRQYTMDLDTELVRSIHEMPEFREFYLKSMADVFYGDKDTNVNINGSNGSYFKMTSDQYAGFLQAYAKDYMRVSFLEESLYHEWARVEVDVLVKKGVGREGYSEQRNTYSYRIMPSFEVTRQWMMDNGHEEIIPSLEDVRSVYIERGYSRFFNEPFDQVDSYDRDIYFEKAIPMDGNMNFIEDRETIEALFNLSYDYSRMYDEDYILNFHMNNGSYAFRVVDLPEGYIVD